MVSNSQSKCARSLSTQSSHVAASHEATMRSSQRQRSSTSYRRMTTSFRLDKRMPSLDSSVSSPAGVATMMVNVSDFLTWSRAPFPRVLGPILMNADVTTTSGSSGSHFRKLGLPAIPTDWIPGFTVSPWRDSTAWTMGCTVYRRLPRLHIPTEQTPSRLTKSTSEASPSP